MNKKAMTSIVAVGLVGLAAGALYWNVFRPSVLVQKGSDAGVSVKSAYYDDENGMVYAHLQWPSEEAFYESNVFVQISQDYLMPVSLQNEEKTRGEVIFPVLPEMKNAPYLVVDRKGKLSSWSVVGYGGRSPKNSGIEPVLNTSSLKLSTAQVDAKIIRFINGIANPNCSLEIKMKPQEGVEVTVDRVQIPIWHNKDGKMTYDFPDELNTSHNNGSVRFDNPAFLTTDLVPVRWKGTEAKLKEVPITDWSYKMEEGRAVATCKVGGETYTFGVLGRGQMQAGPASGKTDKLFVYEGQKVNYFGRIKGAFNLGRVTHEQGIELLKKVKAYQVSDLNEYTCEGVIKANVEVQDKSKATAPERNAQGSRQSL